MLLFLEQLTQTNASMKNLIYIICLFLIFGCSEGDLIELSVEIDAPMQHCSNESENNFVFFTLDQDINRSLSVSFSSSSFNIVPAISAISLEEPIIITLNTSNNFLIYREFEEPIIGQDYFCQSIPPANITVSQEMSSTSGTAEISYELVEESDTSNTYQRTVTLKNTTLEGDLGNIRRDSFVLGSEEIVIEK